MAKLAQNWRKRFHDILENCFRGKIVRKWRPFFKTISKTKSHFLIKH